MRRTNTSAIVGMLLVLGGLLILAQNLGWFGPAESIIWTVLFVGGGLGFLAYFASNRAAWWALIPGFALLSIGTLIGLDVWVPGMTALWGGSIFLAGLSLGFWGVFLACRTCWWAIIPAGILLTLATVAGIDTRASGTLSGAVFFGGVALTFLLVFLAPSVPKRQPWAIYPALVALALSIMTLGAFVNVFTFVWPAALILAGAYLLYRALGHSHTRDAPRPSHPR